MELYDDFDESYLQRLRAGDFKTVDHFVTYFSKLLHLTLRPRLPSTQAIEDVRQETFSRVFKALHSEGGIRHPERLGAFVIAICKNVVMEFHRSGTRESPLEEDDAASNIPDHGADALDIVLAREQQRIVREILEELSEKDRRILKAVFLDEEDKDKVCQDFGVTRDYLRVLLHRAKGAFKSKYPKDKGPDKGKSAGA